MTKTEMEKRISDLREWIFLLDMKDHWSNQDFDLSHKMHRELNDLCKQIKTFKNEN